MDHGVKMGNVEFAVENGPMVGLGFRQRIQSECKKHHLSRG